MPEQTSDPNSSPGNQGPRNRDRHRRDTSDAGARKDGAGAEGQVPAAPPKAPENNLPPTAGGSVTEPAEGDDGGCFEPFIPPVPLPPAPKPVPKPKPPSFMPIIDKATSAKMASSPLRLTLLRRRSFRLPRQPKAQATLKWHSQARPPRRRRDASPATACGHRRRARHLAQAGALGKDAPTRGCGRAGRPLVALDSFSTRTELASVPCHHRHRP